MTAQLRKPIDFTGRDAAAGEARRSRASQLLPRSAGPRRRRLENELAELLDDDFNTLTRSRSFHDCARAANGRRFVMDSRSSASGRCEPRVAPTEF